MGLLGTSTPTPHDQMLRVDTVADLARLAPATLAARALVRVAGYHRPGDGGGGLLRWDPTSTAAGNGGTVHDPYPGRGDRRGRWLAVHDGTGDFRRFGIFGRDTPADAALDAMVGDPTIHRVEAHTDLRFVKRHTFGRSDIELDFGGHTVHTDGIERNTHDNPFGAVLYFRGTVTDTVI
ncbi:hypothetical protein QLR68_32530, partial [Micromonospora sp. DH15]|nr:hypothetical protein [Micromonospora sp. DH15]